MNKRSLQFLETLVNTPSPSGHESRGLRVWLDYVGQYADETYSDAYGNCVAVLNKGGGPRLMLAGHADEIGMTVNYIDDNGYVYVRKLGGTNPAITKAQRLTVHTRKGPVKGVVEGVLGDLTAEIGAVLFQFALGQRIRARDKLAMYPAARAVLADPVLH